MPMRKPSEYLPAALKGLRSRLMPDCSEILRHGEYVAKVTRTGSPSRGEDALIDSDIFENVRVLASAADFPELKKGSLVSLADKWRIVTSSRTDPACASLSVGLSTPLDDVLVIYRRPGTALRQSIVALAVEKEVLDIWGDNVAPTAARGWLVAFSQHDWLENTEPRIGDELVIDERTMRCAAVTKHDGYWLLTCRARR